MDIDSASKFSSIMQGVITLLMFIPTFLSYWKRWPSVLRRSLTVLLCVFLGFTIRTFIASGDVVRTGEIERQLQSERSAREAAERSAAGSEAQTRNQKAAREASEGRMTDLEATLKDETRRRNTAEKTLAELKAALEKADGRVETSEKRTAKIESDLRSLQQELSTKSNERSSAPTAAAPTPEESSPAPVRQRLERFSVEVTDAQIGTNGRATVYLRFINTGKARTKMLLADGFLGQDKTFLVDDTGVRYALENSSGIGTCCFGLAGGDWHGAVVDLAPQADTTVTLSFQRQLPYGTQLPDHPPRNVTLSGELTVGDVVRVQGWSEPQWKSTTGASISLRGITVK